MKKLLLRPQAEADIEAAARWHEKQRPAFGFRFLDAIDDLLVRIQSSPLQFPEIQAGVRRGLLRYFPYSLYFLVIEQRIEVIAVLHQHRDADVWKDRLDAN